MISADTNLFVHAANRDSDLCERAIAFFESHATNSDFVISELVLVELYMCLRNPAILQKPLSAASAVAYCEAIRCNPHWQITDYAPDVQARLWTVAKQKNFAFRRIIDARLALTLQFHGVREFATINLRDFRQFDFDKLWNPLS
jgi:toxin-antitoxin system PIN domain toxin